MRYKTQQRKKHGRWINSFLEIVTSKTPPLTVTPYPRHHRYSASPHLRHPHLKTAIHPPASTPFSSPSHPSLPSSQAQTQHFTTSFITVVKTYMYFIAYSFRCLQLLSLSSAFITITGTPKAPVVVEMMVVL